MNCCTLSTTIVFLKEYNPTPPSSFKPPCISRVKFLLHPHFAMIFGSDADSIFFTYLLVKKIYPNVYSNFGWYTS